MLEHLFLAKWRKHFSPILLSKGVTPERFAGVISDYSFSFVGRDKMLIHKMSLKVSIVETEEGDSIFQAVRVVCNPTCLKPNCWDRSTVDLLIFPMWKWCFHAWIHTHDISTQHKHLFQIWALFTNYEWLMGSEEPFDPTPLSLYWFLGTFSHAEHFWTCQNDFIIVIMSY